jgi:ABC-type nitrate/sulfonate/bicarbonate transport system substrate-binding protein
VPRTRVNPVADGEIDFLFEQAPWIESQMAAGQPITVLAGIHSGCYELFAHEPIRTISDLKGRKVGIVGDLVSNESDSQYIDGGYMLLAVMAAHIGLDPRRDIDWIKPGPSGTPKQLFVEREVDAFLAAPPEAQELRARKIGHVILNTATDKPWSQYFCCMAFGNREFVQRHPVATKRYLRAVLKAADVCAADPAGARPQAGRCRVHEPIRLRAADLHRGAVRRLARVRPGGHAAVLRAPAARGRHDQVDPAGDHRQGYRLALPERDQTRAEGVSLAARECRLVGGSAMDREPDVSKLALDVWARGVVRHVVAIDTVHHNM